jgi:hypothetical protein
MFGSEILDVAIGMVFIYLLLSLICSAVNEIIEAWMKKRATDLEKGIRELLRDEQGGGTVTQLYQHPLVSGLFRGEYNPAQLRHEALTGKVLRFFRLLPEFNVRRNVYRLRGWFLNRGGADLPSYIPSRNFALALMDIVMNPPADGAGSPPGAPRPPPARGLTSPPGGGSYTVEDLRRMLVAHPELPSRDVNRALQSLLDTAGDNINGARERIEKWYDSSMDRVSGWYKRRTQVIILFLGLGTAVVVNADTIAIFKSLMNDPPLRNSLVAAAAEYARSNSPADNANTNTNTNANVNANTNAAVVNANTNANTNAGRSSSTLPAAGGACAEDPKSPECKVEKNLQQIKKLGLPVGWDCSDERSLPQCVQFSLTPWQWAVFQPGGSAWLLKFFGWLLTGVAVSLGAPFWFDLLNKFMVIRSTVKPHEKSPEEKSND